MKMIPQSTTNTLQTTKGYNPKQYDILKAFWFDSENAESIYQLPREQRPLLHGHTHTNSFDSDNSLSSYGSSATLADNANDASNQSCYIVDLPNDAQYSNSFWRELCVMVSPICIILSNCATAGYLSLRTYYSIISGSTPNSSWLLLLSEVSFSLYALLNMSWAIFSHKARHKQPRRRLQGNKLPRVDVFITCCNEELDVILNTVMAACHLDYSKDAFRVIVLDDGKSSVLRISVAELGISNLYYHSRTKIPGQPHHYKAGNQNGGLMFVENLPGGPGEFVASLDADMIPEKDWLRAALVPMISDELCGLTCPPQAHYDIPVNDPLNQTMNMQTEFSEPVRNAIGVAWCTGSGFIVRRRALNDIGGSFPTQSLGEDVLCSLMLNGANWKTSYVHETLQYGSVPDGYGSHIKQRTRWTIGHIQTGFYLRFCLWGEKVQYMTPWQRLCGFTNFLTAISCIPVTIGMALYLIVIASGKPVIAFDTPKELNNLIWLAAISIISQLICERIAYFNAGYECSQRSKRNVFWMAPYYTVAIIRHYLPASIGGALTTFISSGSLRAQNQMQPLPFAQQPLHKRLGLVLMTHHAIGFVVYILCMLGAVATSSYTIIRNSETPDQAVKGLLAGPWWLPLLWIPIISSLCTPLFYALCPPINRSMQEILIKDSDGVLRHKDGLAQGEWTWCYVIRRELENFVMLMFIALGLVFTYYFII